MEELNIYYLIPYIYQWNIFMKDKFTLSAVVKEY